MRVGRGRYARLVGSLYLALAILFVVVFVIPAGQIGAFNLDGSTLYRVLASVTIARAAGIEQSLGEPLIMLVAFMLTSKGVAGVPRATLVIIARWEGVLGEDTEDAAIESER